MKIMLCASMSFATNIKIIESDLEKLGHQVMMASDIDHMITNPNQSDDLDADLKHCIDKEILKDAFGKVAQSDAILVLNYPKNGVHGYIGTSSLMEMAVAYHLGKRIFLMNAAPDYHQHRWSHEVAIMQALVIESDLELIV